MLDRSLRKLRLGDERADIAGSAEACEVGRHTVRKIHRSSCQPMISQPMAERNARFGIKMLPKHRVGSANLAFHRAQRRQPQFSLAKPAAYVNNFARPSP